MFEHLTTNQQSININDFSSNLIELYNHYKSTNNDTGRLYTSQALEKLTNPKKSFPHLEGQLNINQELEEIKNISVNYKAKQMKNRIIVNAVLLGIIAMTTLVILLQNDTVEPIVAVLVSVGIYLLMNVVFYFRAKLFYNSRVKSQFKSIIEPNVKDYVEYYLG